MTKIGFITFFILLSKFGAAQQAPANMPTFSSLTNVYEANRSWSEALPTRGKIAFIFYDPGCGHCQELGAGISKNIDKVKDVSLLFISMNDKEYVDGYINMFAKGLKGKKNVSFWKENGVEFIEKMMPENYPAMYIYDARTKKLLKSFQGEGNLSKILPFLQ